MRFLPKDFKSFASTCSAIDAQSQTILGGHLLTIEDSNVKLILKITILPASHLCIRPTN